MGSERNERGALQEVRKRSTRGIPIGGEHFLPRPGHTVCALGQVKAPPRRASRKPALHASGSQSLRASGAGRQRRQTGWGSWRRRHLQCVLSAAVRWGVGTRPRAWPLQVAAPRLPEPPGPARVGKPLTQQLLPSARRLLRPPRLGITWTELGCPERLSSTTRQQRAPRRHLWPGTPLGCSLLR